MCWFLLLLLMDCVNCSPILWWVYWHVQVIYLFLLLWNSQVYIQPYIVKDNRRLNILNELLLYKDANLMVVVVAVCCERTLSWTCTIWCSRALFVNAVSPQLQYSLTIVTLWTATLWPWISNRPTSHRKFIAIIGKCKQNHLLWNLVLSITVRICT